MGDSLINMIEIAKQTEVFYLSPLNSSYISVVMNYPINDTVPFKVTRRSSYQATLNQVLANIMIYFSVCSKVIVTANGVIKELVGVGAQHKNLILQEIATKKLANNNIGNSYIGTGGVLCNS